nr:MAG TPA: peptidyl-prolyl cis-transisomerase [Caudoviricetes sp.]
MTSWCEKWEKCVVQLFQHYLKSGYVGLEMYDLPGVS